MLLKVVAYITKQSEHGSKHGAGHETELLVFRHPRHIKTPIQVPQGTVEEEELIVDGLWRELKEETGRSDFTLVGQIAKVPFYADWRDEWQERNVVHLTAPSDTPDTWTHVVTGGESDKGLRFEFFWLPLADAEQQLHWSQNQWLNRLGDKPS
jgi:8-oxo-dGTP pyrophosphatase MutT (NUDIX family)